MIETDTCTTSFEWTRFGAAMKYVLKIEKKYMLLEIEPGSHIIYDQQYLLYIYAIGIAFISKIFMAHLVNISQIPSTVNTRIALINWYITIIAMWSHCMITLNMNSNWQCISYAHFEKPIVYRCSQNPYNVINISLLFIQYVMFSTTNSSNFARRY